MNKKNQYTDEEILAAIQSGEAKRYNEVLKYLFEATTLQATVKKLSREKGLDPDSEFVWVLNDSLLVFYESVLSGNYDPSKASIKTYIIAVAKKIIHTYKRSRDRDVARMIKLTEFDPDNPLNEYSSYSTEQLLLLKEKNRAMKTALVAIGPRCEKIISLYFQKYKGEEIAQQMNLTLNSAKDALKTCRKKLHQYLTEHDEVRIIIRGK